jgi:hypothetical protein
MIPFIRCKRRCFKSWLLAGLVALSLVLPVAAVLAVSPQDNGDDSATISIILEPEPSIQVEPGGIIAYKVSARNTGESFASLVRAWIDYDPTMLTIIDTTFERDGDWISKKSPGYIRLEFNGVGEDKTHWAIIHAQVAETVPSGTVINMWAGYEWKEEGIYAQENSSNAAPVLVGETNLTSSWVWMTVEPFQAAQGKMFSFYSDRFVPGEDVKVWLQTWGDVDRKRSLDTDADGHGRLWIHLPSEELAPGFHQIIIEGTRSELVAGQVFLVKPEILP